MAGIIKASLQGTKRETQLAQAREQSAQILADAEYEAEQIRRAAERNAYGDAMDAARELARQQIDERIDSLSEAISQASKRLLQAEDSWKKHWETRVVQLAIAIAERVIRREVGHAPNIPQTLVCEALELAAGSNRIKIRLHPQDVEFVGDSIESVGARNPEINPMEFVADESISRGGCLVETQFGEIDQRIETQLARIEEELT